MNGIYVASATPYDAQGRFSAPALHALMERNLGQGADGFFIGGSSGECFLLSHKERVEVFRAAAAFRDRTTLIGHVGAISTDEAVDFAHQIRSLGYRVVAATPPFYYGFSPREIAGYYHAIAQAAGMPVLIYNFPGNTHKVLDLSNADTVELLRSGDILGVKHTNYDIFQLERIKNLNPELLVFDGFDETMVAGLAMGADGAIGSTFNVMLPAYRRIYDTFLGGDFRLAQALQVKANNVMEAMCRVGLIASIKYVLTRQGIPAGDPRRPFTPLSEAQRQAVDQSFAQNCPGTY